MDTEQSGGPSGTAYAGAQDSTHHPYDVYIRDMPRSSGFFKHAQAYRMFPVHEPRVRVDDYGEMIDPRAYMREEEQNAIEFSALQKEDGEKEDMEVSKEESMLESEQYHGGQGLKLEDAVPSKYVEYKMDLKVCCQVVYIDFEGRSDGKSIKNILAQVAPRKLVCLFIFKWLYSM
jgi:cleavage and polyadenylation specificity factor subunit 2